MPHYKVCFLQNDGHIFCAEDHELGDDLSALEVAENLSANHPIEVWQLDRMVLRVKKGNEPLAATDQRCL